MLNTCAMSVKLRILDQIYSNKEILEKQHDTFISVRIKCSLKMISSTTMSPKVNSCIKSLLVVVTNEGGLWRRWPRGTQNNNWLDRATIKKTALTTTFHWSLIETFHFDSSWYFLVNFTWDFWFKCLVHSPVVSTDVFWSLTTRRFLVHIWAGVLGVEFVRERVGSLCGCLTLWWTVTGPVCPWMTAEMSSSPGPQPPWTRNRMIDGFTF